MMGTKMRVIRSMYQKSMRDINSEIERSVESDQIQPPRRQAVTPPPPDNDTENRGQA